MICSICQEPLIESRLSVSGYVHAPDPLKPLIEEVMKVCYGKPIPHSSDYYRDRIEKLEDELADAHSFIVRLSHYIQDFEEGVLSESRTVNSQLF